jgi:hypothetical protein
MKGKLVLIPVTEPVEGMRVIAENYFYNERYAPGIITSIVDNDFISVAKDEKHESVDVPVNLCRQVIVEYWENNPPPIDRSRSLQTLPLHPTDWEWSIQHIGEEVDFNKIPICQNCGTEYCDNLACRGIPDWEFAQIVPVEETWDSLWEKRCELVDGIPKFKYVGQFWEWLKENYHPPKKKYHETILC